MGRGAAMAVVLATLVCRAWAAGTLPGSALRSTDSLRSVLLDAFRAGGPTLAGQPGPGVLRPRIAVTGITPERPG
jgi:hypothetical protein